MSKNILLEMKSIEKIYSNGVIANRNVEFQVEYGEIHALLGENGAGKSTLMKILYGMQKPDRGKIIFNSQEVEFSSPKQAMNLGIGMVHQHFMLVPSFSVLENVVLGREPKKGFFKDLKEARRQVEVLCERYHFFIDLDAKVSDLSVGLKQKVEILKALYQKAKLLILDEPTAVLTPQESEELFIQLQRLKKEGMTIIYISHKLDEIKRICDRLSIMRKGQSIGTFRTQDMSIAKMSNLMVGRDIVEKYEKEEKPTSNVILDIKNGNSFHEQGKQKLKNIHLKIREREIVGIAGVEGNGQNELAEFIMGLQKEKTGSILLDGKDILHDSVQMIRSLGVSYIPEDRMREGVAKNLSIQDNLLSTKFNQMEFSHHGVIRKDKSEHLAQEKIEEYQIAARNQKEPVAMLSGGNIQKVVVAREFSVHPRLVIANQPTRGIDIGAAQFIRKKLVEIRDSGSGVLLISADLQEILEISDRVLVFYKGEIVGEFTDVQKLSEKEIGEYMLGVKRMIYEKKYND